MRIIVGISGASGAAYGLEVLRQLHMLQHEIHCVVSQCAWDILGYECGATPHTVEALVARLYTNEQMDAAVASGSFACDAMVIVPCSMKTLAAVACGLADTLLCRAADVMLKERKNLVLAVRETPYNAVHLENMLRLARLGVGIMPLSPGMYHKPATIEELVRQMAGRILDNLHVPNNNVQRWQGLDE